MLRPEQISLNTIYSSYLKSEGIFFTLDKSGQIVLRNLKKENEFFSHEKFYKNECDSYNYLYYENFACYHNDAHGSDYFRHGCRIKKGMKVLDLGANIGLFAISALENGASRVFCFEPIKSTYNCLVYNAERFGNLIETFNIGISDKSGSAIFTLHTDWSHNGGGKMKSLETQQGEEFYTEVCVM